jgi:hypothetical protein
MPYLFNAKPVATAHLYAAKMKSLEDGKNFV